MSVTLYGLNLQTSESFTPRETYENPPKLTVCEKITRIFCFCCFKPVDKSESPLPSPSVTRKSFELGFRYTGEGNSMHRVLSPPKPLAPIVGSFEPAALYTRLNALDYALVKKLIESEVEPNSEKQKTILKELETLWEQESFISPDELASRVDDFPEDLLERIKAIVCLDLVFKQGADLGVGRNTPYNQITNALHTYFCKQSKDVFFRHTARTFKNIDEQVMCIRWGALHNYRLDRKPEYFTETESKESKKKFVDADSPKTNSSSSSSDEDNH